MINFYTPWKNQKTRSFLMFSDIIEIELWLKMLVYDDVVDHIQ